MAVALKGWGIHVLEIARCVMSMSSPRTHRDLIVWQKAMRLAAESYLIAKKLPGEERFELGAQIRAAASSISANVAEGKGRRGKAEYARFLSIARGSARELDSHLSLAVLLRFVPPADVHRAQRLLDEVSRMLTAMMQRLAPL